MPIPSTPYPQNGRILYNIAMREPYQVPDELIKLPPPPQQLSPPPSPNFLMLLLPPLLMILGSVINLLVNKSSSSPWVMLPMVMMGLGLPAANLVNVNSQKKKFKKALINREKSYKQTLQQIQKHMDELVMEQRVVLEREFPDAAETLAIGTSGGTNKRLWWRRPGEQDFLRVRLGCGEATPTFKVEPPNIMGSQDNLSDLPFELLENYRKVDNLPFLIDLKHIGSLATCAEKAVDQIRLVRRLLTDLIVHHSPEDVELFVVSDHQKAAETWQWLRWVPHTRSLDPGNETAHLLFDKDHINAFMDNLKTLFFERLERIRGYSGNNTFTPLPAICVVMDDAGAIRQNPDVARISAEGYLAGIYLIFLSKEKVPRTCRARLELDQSQHINYLETIESTGTGDNRQGKAELLRGSDVLVLARKLAGLAVAGGERSVVLPSTVRITSILNQDPLSIDTIISNWQLNTHDSQQVLLPVGQYVDRTGLATFEIDFRPEGLGGKGAYHAMMIGTTGSGKSIFMQSMVLAAAHRFSPRQINFLFMDFKAGAAELKKISDLPHSVGMITDLSPALAERALQALENELSRRKIVFDSAGKITDIWDYNRRFPTDYMPHLLVVIDEFAEGINILPNLVDRLRELGRQGRAFGMYFFLANQEVNSAVESLKANVSWYILLKVNRQEEMSLIGRNYPVPSGRGHGYIKVKSEVTTIRGAYAGLPANAGDQYENEIGEYTISTFTLDGKKKLLYRYDPKQGSDGKAVFVTELDSLMTLIKDAAVKLDIPKAAPIYLEPMPEEIPLSKVITDSDNYRLFDGKEWLIGKAERNLIPTGFVDIPSRCQQRTFSLDFNEGGGHLWVVGSPGSGKSLTLLSIAVSLAMTHSPDVAHVYVLEFGMGALSCLAAFPHTGAVIKSHEAERIDRLFNFLRAEIQRRTEGNWRSEGLPDIYLIINNVADFRQQYPDQSEEMGRFIRSGGAAGIHIIISSNRGTELPRTLGANIPRRIVLQMAERQDYLDVLNAMVPPLSLKTDARGYYLTEEIAECQVAIPDSNLLAQDLNSERPLQLKMKKRFDIQDVSKLITDLGKTMTAISTDFSLPEPVDVMKDTLTLDDFSIKLSNFQEMLKNRTIPLALLYDDLNPIFSDLDKELPFWTVLGPRQSGKSTFLAHFIFQILSHLYNDFEVNCIAFKKGLLSEISLSNPALNFVTDLDQVLELCQTFPAVIEKDPDTFRVLMIDDVGLPYLNNNQSLTKSLDALADALMQSPHDHFLFLIADMAGNLRGPHAYSSSLIKLFQQNQTGIFFSMDDNDTQWFNTRITPQLRKTYNLPTGANLPAGRGFLVRKGKLEYVQIPWITSGHIKSKMTTT